MIENAYASANAAHATSQGGAFGSLLIMAVLFGLFYFLLVRPQTKRVQEHRNLVSGLAMGDEVVTSGGLVGRITKLTDNFVVLQIAQGVEVAVQRFSVNNTLPKGTIETL